MTSCPTLSEPMNCSTPGSSALLYLPEFAQIHVHWVTDAIYLILCHPLLLLPSIFPSIRVFSSESALHIRWPKDCSISPSDEYSGLISFRMDWFDLLVVQGTLKSSLAPWFKSISSLALSFMVQLSHLYMTTAKTIAVADRPSLAKWCLCFPICGLGLS